MHTGFKKSKGSQLTLRVDVVHKLGNFIFVRFILQIAIQSSEQMWVESKWFLIVCGLLNVSNRFDLESDLVYNVRIGKRYKCGQLFEWNTCYLLWFFAQTKAFCYFCCYQSIRMIDAARLLVLNQGSKAIDVVLLLIKFKSSLKQKWNNVKNSNLCIWKRNFDVKNKC